MADPTDPAESVSFEVQLRSELVKSERSRVTIVAVIAAVSVVYTLGLIAFVPELLERAFAGRSRTELLLVPAALFALVVYAIGMRLLLTRWIAIEQECTYLYRVLTGLFEASYPTVLIFLFGQLGDPFFLMVSPILLLYAVFIASTTLQMDPKIPIIASGVAGVGYLAAYLYFHGRVDLSDYPPWLTAGNGFAGRTLFLLLCGLVSAFIAAQIRKRVVAVVETKAEKDRVTRTFGQHVSPQVVDRLLGQRAGDVSESRNVCIIFLDIRNFTTLSETRSPEEVVEILNTLFEFMIDAINENDGFINKFLGDGFMAVFGAPFSDGRDSQNAVNAARTIIQRLDEEKRRRELDIDVGIGLHAGEAVTGNVGSSQRKEYTVIGDVVNVASRIESLNKTYDSRILISDAVRESLGAEIENCTDLGLAKVKGRDAAVRIFRLS